MTSPTPLKISELTQDELEALQGSGRIVGDTVIPAKEEAVTAKPSTLEIPEPPPGVAERLRTTKRLEASMVHQTTGPSPEYNKTEKVGDADQIVDAPEIKEDPVETEDKNNYLAMLLGAKYFTKTYKLFGGRFAVTFRTRTAAEEDECAQQTNRDERRDGVIGPITSDIVRGDRLRRFQNYQFVAALHRIEVANEVARIFTPFDNKVGEDTNVQSIRIAYEDLIKELSHPVLVALRDAHQKFEYLVMRMTMAATKDDFWTAESAT